MEGQIHMKIPLSTEKKTDPVKITNQSNTNPIDHTDIPQT